MITRLTVPARRAVTHAESAARAEAGAVRAHGRSRPQIEPVHLLLGLLYDDEGSALRVLTDQGVTYTAVHRQVLARRGGGGRAFTEEDAAALRIIGIELPEVLSRAEAAFGPDLFADPPSTERGPRPSKPRLSRSSRAVLTAAVRESQRRHSDSIACEHLLLGLLSVDDPEVNSVLLALGVELDALRSSALRTIEGAA